MTEGIFHKLMEKYLELEELAYRTSVAGPRGRVRSPRGFRREFQTSDPVLKKVDLDRELARLYQRFFDESP